MPKSIYSKKITSDVIRLKKLFQRDTPVLYLFIGDSVTQGALHTYGMRCYPEIFAERVRWEMRRTTDIVVNCGVSGLNTSALLEVYDWYVDQFKCDLVFIMFGINDCQEGKITLGLFEENLNLIIYKIRTKGAIPILQTPNAIDKKGVIKMKTDSRQKLPNYVGIIRKIAEEKQVILVDNWRYWESKGLDHYKKWMDDPLHPNSKGHLEIARLIFKTFSIFDPNAFTCIDK